MPESKGLLQWDKSLNIGIKGIDHQHQKLLEKLNAFLDSITLGKGVDEVSSTIKFLELYVKIHFSTEEKYMEKYSYPGLESHKKLHHYFTQIVKDIKKEFLAEGASMQLRAKIIDEV